MPHFFIPPGSVINGTFSIAGPEAHHLIAVRRCQCGDTLHLFDGTGKTFVGRVTAVTRTELQGVVLHEIQVAPPPIAVHLYHAVPKGDRFDWLVEKAAELGVAAITPIIAERSVSRDVSTAKVERWNRLSVAASQQSGRRDIMRVHDPRSFSDGVMAAGRSAVSIIPWEGESSRAIRDISCQPALHGSVSILIGPEGGFSGQEIERARLAKVVPVTLGTNILRVETAGILATILVMNAAGLFT